MSGTKMWHNLEGWKNVHLIYKKPKHGCHGNIRQKLNLGIYFHGIVSPEKLTPRIKECVASYHTTESYSTLKAKKWFSWQHPSRPKCKTIPCAHLRPQPEQHLSLITK